MKAGDFFRNGGRYLDRMDTFFDKAWVVMEKKIVS